MKRIGYIGPLRMREVASSGVVLDFSAISESIMLGTSTRVGRVEWVTSDRMAWYRDIGKLTKVMKGMDVIVFDVSLADPGTTYLLGLASASDVPAVLIKAGGSKALNHVVLRYRLHEYSPDDIEDRFLDTLAASITTALQDPFAGRLSPGSVVAPRSAFVSYSRRDGPYFDRLMVHLAPLVRDNNWEIWSDQSLRAGDDWEQAIRRAIETSRVAVLLLSADFFASEFIHANELPLILERAESGSMAVLPILLAPCNYARHPVLSRIQAANDLGNPLAGMERHQQDKVFDEAAQDVARLLGRS